jgi:hypothetical protein
MTFFLTSLLNYSAASATADCGQGKAFCATGLPVVGAGTNELQEITAIVFGLLAAVAVLMIVIAGLRFITAQGNAQEIAKARSTIVYSIAGLIVCIIAEAIVAFVLDKVT